MRARRDRRRSRPAGLARRRPDPPGRQTSASGTCGRGTGIQASSIKVAAHPRFDRRPPGRTTVRGSGQDGCGTPRFPPYRCFLPDLTGFGDPGCAGPDLQRRLPRPVLRTQTSAMEFGPAKADCRCRVPPAPHLARPKAMLLAVENSSPRAHERHRAHLARPKAMLLAVEKAAPELMKDTAPT